MDGIWVIKNGCTEQKEVDVENSWKRIIRRDEIIMKTKESIEVKRIKMQEWPKVAIIILNWNGWKDTIECLESVFRNTYPNYQIVVVDNGSTDSSMEKIKAWAEGKQEVLTPESSHPLYYLSHPPVKKLIPYVYYTRKEAERCGNIKLEEKITKELQEQVKINSEEFNPTTFHPLIFIQTGENLGFAGGNNVGIRYASTKKDFDYIWLLNNDTVIYRDALMEMVKLAESDERIGILGSKLLFYDKPDIIQVLGGTNKITWKNTGGIPICCLKKDKDRFNNNFELKGYICGASLLAKMELIKTINLLDENYFMFTEETDWCFKASKKDWKLFCNGKSKIWHKVGASSKNNVEKFFSINYYDYYGTRNHLYFVRKHFPKYFILACIYLFFKILRQSIRIILYNNNKLFHMKILYKGFCDGIKEKMGKYIIK